MHRYQVFVLLKKLLSAPLNTTLLNLVSVGASSVEIVLESHKNAIGNDNVYLGPCDWRL